MTIERFVVVCADVFEGHLLTLRFLAHEKVVNERFERFDNGRSLLLLYLVDGGSEGSVHWEWSGINLSQYNSSVSRFKPSMSTQFYSDEETIDRYNESTLEHLINQNKMKDLALSKATNLIDLLNIELEVEKNNNQENIRQLQHDLNQKYEAELRSMREKIEMLQRELSRTSSISNSTEKTMRHSSFARANSLRSIENKRKRSINKKYTEHQTIESNDNKTEIPPYLSINNELFKKQMLVIDEWKTEVIEEIESLVQQAYNQLSELINSIQACSDDFEQMIVQKPIKRSPFGEMARIIKDQQGIINSLRAYTQELEDMNKNIIFKLQSLGREHLQQKTSSQFNSEALLIQAKMILVKQKEEWRHEVNGLEVENNELKNILDSMIKLVKEEKKLKL